MSRVAKSPVSIPALVDVSLEGLKITVKGPKGTIAKLISETQVEVRLEGGSCWFTAKDETAVAQAMAGTLKATIKNMIAGVTKGFERKLILVGVGYKAQAQGKVLNLSLGFSHPVKFEIPAEISIETPSQTEVVIRGIDKHLVGQVAADIRAFRPPEPYKGKGVKYEGEVIVMKEGKKK